MITVALTGATGFIGSGLLNKLTAQGYRVKALYRPSSTPTNHADTAEWLAGDLDDHDSLRTFVSGADLVIHCAGTVRGTTLESFTKINTDGVGRLLQAAEEQGVSRFLLISSLAAREPTLSYYAESKKLGEDVLRQHHGKISWGIFRPPAVYGPGDREMQPLLKLIKRGIIPAIGSRHGSFSLLHVDDLAAAVLCLLKTSNNTQHGRCFELHDGQAGGYNWQQIAQVANRLNGKTPLIFSIPRIVMQIAGVTNLSVARLLGYQPMLTPGKVKELFHPDWVCDNTLITKTIGWQPQILFQEGMKRIFY